MCLQIQLLRSRQSLIHHSPRKSTHPDSAAGLPHRDSAGSDLSSAGPPAVEGLAQEDNWESGEREQRLIYLRQAFCGFFRAKQGLEMQNLARVMCAILAVDAEEQSAIMESIERLVPALVATSTIESLSYNFSSLFS